MQGRGILALGGVAVAFGFTVPQARAATLRVDDDLAQCPVAAYTAIQDAVDAASPGDTILVCPGSYHESVQVDRRVTLRARTPHPDVPRCTAAATPPNPSRQSIVQSPIPGPFFPAISLQANGAALEGFVIQGSTGNPGVYASPSFSGYRLERNLIQDNSIGISLQSSGATLTRVVSNCIRSNNEPGSASGNGIYSEQGIAKADVRGNRFFENDNAGVYLTNVAGATPSPTAVTLSHNVVQDGLNAGIVIVRSTASQLDHNIIRGGADGSAIVVGPGNGGLRLVSNILQGKYRGIHVRNDPFTYGFPSAPSTGLVIQGNIVQNMAADGLRVATGSMESSLVIANVITGSGEDGIKVNALCVLLAAMCDEPLNPGLPTAGNGGNVFRSNVASGSGIHDCHDATQGGGVGGTANTWAGNSGTTANRVGICSPGSQIVPPFDHDPFS